MDYIWTEDSGAGLHYWNLVNEHLLQNRYTVESKGSNQGILDAVRELSAKHPGQIVILDMICFEYIILSFSKLVDWNGTGKTDKIAMRKVILSAVKGHKIDIDSIADKKTLEYLMRFKRYSTERVIKAVTYELTENDEWSVKGKLLGGCWYQNCCVVKDMDKKRCNIGGSLSGDLKIRELIEDSEMQKICMDL